MNLYAEDGRDAGQETSGKILPQLRAPVGWIYGSIAIAVPVTSFAMTVRQVSLPVPFEDAAMLFRYAENFAAGHGVAWNVGESPAVSDGATDLLFVFILGVLIRLGMTATAAAITVNLVAVFGIGYVMHLANKNVWKFSPYIVVPAIFATLLGPAWSIIAGGFSAAAFGYILTLVFVLTVTTVSAGKDFGQSQTSKWALAIGALASLAGWWRPEGFFLAPMVVVAGLYCARRVRTGRAPIQRGFWMETMHGALVFASSVALWVAVRLLYFGSLFPSSGSNKLQSVSLWRALLSPILDPSARTTIAYFVTILGPVLAVVFVVAARKMSPLLIIEVLFVIFVATIVWTPFNLTFNWWGRVYWPLIPVITCILLTLTAATSSREHFAFGRRYRLLSIGAIAGTVLWTHVLVPTNDTVFPTLGQYFESPFHTSVYRALLPLDTSNVRVATTEAGLIPLSVKSGFALDTYVHNTRSITEGGASAIPPAIQAFGPNVMVAHGRRPHEFLGTVPCEGPFSTLWRDQVDAIYVYAKSNNFRLITSFEAGECDTWNIFVSDDVDSHVLNALSRLEIEGIPLR